MHNSCLQHSTSYSSFNLQAAFVFLSGSLALFHLRTTYALSELHSTNPMWHSLKTPSQGNYPITFKFILRKNS